MKKKFKEKKNKIVKFVKKRTCLLSHCAEAEIDYKNIDLLAKFLNDYNNILPRKITLASNKKQSLLALSIKRAKRMALLPV